VKRLKVLRAEKWEVRDTTETLLRTGAKKVMPRFLEQTQGGDLGREVLNKEPGPKKSQIPGCAWHKESGGPRIKNPYLTPTGRCMETLEERVCFVMTGSQQNRNQIEGTHRKSLEERAISPRRKSGVSCQVSSLRQGHRGLVELVAICQAGRPCESGKKTWGRGDFTTLCPESEFAPPASSR